MSRKICRRTALRNAAIVRWGDEQRKLDILAELRRSRDQVMKAVETQGLNKSKMHVLAAPTRLRRQICCHPSLVGSDTASGTFETLFELLDPLIADGAESPGLFTIRPDVATPRKGNALYATSIRMCSSRVTKDRQEVVNAFQADAMAGVFLLSQARCGNRTKSY